MDPQRVSFLEKNRIAVFTALRKDGSPHSAALHYSYINEPFEFYFSTDKGSRKCEALLDGKSVKASVIIGFSEEEWLTLQMDGDVIAIIDQDELARVQTIHYAKHPNSAKYKDDPGTIFLKFIPTWYRYTDFNTNPMTIVSSE